ncbi:MAG: hypothetical protein ABJA78_03865 [Ferruginibacter sp.]
MKSPFLFLLSYFFLSCAFSQQHKIDSFSIGTDVQICIDRPDNFKASRKTLLIFFALPNGNSIPQTMGKKMKPGDDWHYDIQHIKAQTGFLRKKINHKNVVVVYAGNRFNAWPLWKQKHTDYPVLINHIIDTVVSLFASGKTTIALNGHSGGGSFVLGYLKTVDEIPDKIERISFLDSDYGYDSSYNEKFVKWVRKSKKNQLNVFAYNDSVALYDGKPIVSATGGTWYRSHLMLTNLENDFSFTGAENDSLIFYTSVNKQIHFFFKKNPDRKIFHTQQVELNGFIHSILCGTRYESKGYLYYGKRAYDYYIEK